MGQVIHLFTRQQIDDLDGDPDAIFEFIEQHFSAFQLEVEQMAESTTVDQMKASMRKVKEMVAAWPDDV